MTIITHQSSRITHQPSRHVKPHKHVKGKLIVRSGRKATVPLQPPSIGKEGGSPGCQPSIRLPASILMREAGFFNGK
jgi:hypothetical protein